MKLKALQITPLANGWAITELDLPDYVGLSETLTIKENLGEAYSYPSTDSTVIGFIRQYLDKQVEANTPPESP